MDWIITSKMKDLNTVLDFDYYGNDQSFEASKYSGQPYQIACFIFINSPKANHT